MAQEGFSYSCSGIHGSWAEDSSSASNLFGTYNMPLDDGWLNLQEAEAEALTLQFPP